LSRLQHVLVLGGEVAAARFHDRGPQHEGGADQTGAKFSLLEMLKKLFALCQ